MEFTDIEIVLNNMKPVDRFVFGVKYLWHSAKSKLTKKDTAGPFLHAEIVRQSVLLRRIDAGEIQI